MCEAILAFVLLVVNLPGDTTPSTCPEVAYVQPGEMKVPGASGVYDPQNGAIQIDATLPQDQRQATLAHELVHYVLDQAGLMLYCHAEEAVAYWVGLQYVLRMLPHDSPLRRVVAAKIGDNPLRTVMFVSVMAERSCGPRAAHSPPSPLGSGSPSAASDAGVR